jgi:dGTPase
VCDLISTSRTQGSSRVLLSEEVDVAMTSLRDWLFDHVYRSEIVHADFEKASYVLTELFGYFLQHPDELKQHRGGFVTSSDAEIEVADFIAGMTDRYALSLYEELFLPRPWKTA